MALKGGQLGAQCHAFTDDLDRDREVGSRTLDIRHLFVGHPHPWPFHFGAPLLHHHRATFHVGAPGLRRPTPNGARLIRTILRPGSRGYAIEGTTKIGTLGATLAVAIPVLVFSTVLFLLYTYLVHQGDPFHGLLAAGTVLLLAAAVVVAAAGGSIGTCLILITLSPTVVVVGFETVGHRHAAVALARALG